LKKCLIALVLLVLMSASCLAVSVNVPSTIVVGQEQKDVPITVSVNSSRDTDFEASFSSPFNAYLIPSSGTLKGGKAEILTLSISPNKALEGSNYNVVFEAEIGEEKVFRNVRVIFSEEAGTGQGSAEDNGTGPEAGEGFSGSSGSETGEGVIEFQAYALAGLYSWVEGLVSFENIVNIVLVVVAAILLIAFIARFVKRLEAEK